MISYPSFHAPTSVIVLHSEPNVRNQSPIILGNRALHLPIIKGPPKHNKTLSKLSQISGKLPRNKQNPRKSERKKHTQILRTLISLKGIKRLFSSLESNPRMRAAWRKLRFVAARAFMAAWKTQEKEGIPTEEK